MKVITHLLGRVVLPTPSEEIVPKEGVYYPDVVDAIAAQYHFKVKPDLATLSLEEMSTKGLLFRLGKLVYEGKEHSIIDFTVYDQTLVVSAHDTEVARTFLHDAFKTLAEHYNFRNDGIVDSRMLVLNEMVVQFEDVFDNAIRNFDVISQTLQSALTNQYGRNDKYRATGIMFDFSRELIPPPMSNLAHFLLERRSNRPYGENRYFARAPFHTRAHIQLLTEIESIFKK